VKSMWENKTALQYVHNEDGQFAVIFALIAVPLMLAAGIALEYGRIENTRTSVKHALDAAVLAAVSNGSISDGDREKLAKKVFQSHFTDISRFDLKADSKDGIVMMTAVEKTEPAFSKLMGISSFNINVKSVAEMTRDNTICVMAMAESGRGKLRFLNQTEFNSPTCSVQSNSSDTYGAISSSSIKPIAKSFCSVGGASGTFSPQIRANCRKIDDPYVYRKAPAPGACVPTEVFGYTYDKKGKPVFENISPTQLTNGHEDPGAITVSIVGKHEHPHCHYPDPTGFQQCHISNHKVGDVHAASEGYRLEYIGLPAADIARLTADYNPDHLAIAESINYTTTNGIYRPGTYCGGLTVDGQNVSFLPGTYIIKDGPLTFKNGASAKAHDVSFVMHGTNASVTVESGSNVDLKAPRSGPMAGLALYQDKSALSPNLLSAQPPPTAVHLLSSGGQLNVTGKAGLPPLLPRSDDGARLTE